MSEQNLMQTKLSDLHDSQLDEYRSFYTKLVDTLDTFVADQLMPLLSYVCETYEVQVETDFHRPNGCHDMGIGMEEMALAVLGKYYMPGNGTEFELVIAADGQIYQAYRCKDCIMKNDHFKLRKPQDGVPQYLDLTSQRIMELLSRLYSDATRIQDRAKEEVSSALQQLDAQL